MMMYLHMYIASKGKSAECSKNGKSFTNSCNRSSKLMDVLTIKLKEYINLDIEKGDMQIGSNPNNNLTVMTKYLRYTSVSANNTI